LDSFQKDCNIKPLGGGTLAKKSDRTPGLSLEKKKTEVVSSVEGGDIHANLLRGQEQAKGTTWQKSQKKRKNKTFPFLVGLREGGSKGVIPVPKEMEGKYYRRSG